MIVPKVYPNEKCLDIIRNAVESMTADEQIEILFRNEGELLAWGLLYAQEDPWTVHKTSPCWLISGPFKDLDYLPVYWDRDVPKRSFRVRVYLSLASMFRDMKTHEVHYFSITSPDLQLSLGEME